MEIYARFLDMNSFESIKVSKVYLQIISTDDHEYWPSSIIKKNMATLHIAIGTLEMKDEQYIVKVSDHKEMISFGFNKVKIRKKWFFESKKQHLQFI